MYNPTQKIEEPKPPQGLHIPALIGKVHFPIEALLLSKGDADQFHAGFEKMRQWLATQGNENYVKEKSLEDLQNGINTYMVGVKNPDDGSIISGAIVTTPIDSRSLAGKFPGYPFGTCKEDFAVVGATFTAPEYVGKKIAPVVIQKILEVAPELHGTSATPEQFRNVEATPSGYMPGQSGLRHVLAGVVHTNAPGQRLFEKMGFKEIHKRTGENDRHMNYMRYEYKP